MSRGDPYWTTAKFDSSKGGVRIRKGDRIFYYPNTKTALVGEAAERAARDFEHRRYQAARDNAQGLPLEKKIAALRKASNDLIADYAAVGMEP